MTAQPDPACIADLGAFLAAMPLLEGQKAFQVILDALRRDLPARMRWSPEETEVFVIRFADALADELNAMPIVRVLH